MKTAKSAIEAIAQQYDANGKPTHPIKVRNTRAYLRQFFKPEKRGGSGLIGAAYPSGTRRFRATIRVDGKRKFLGWFATADDAHAAYTQASKAHHGEFSPC